MISGADMEFKTFDLGEAQGKGIRNAMAQMQTMGTANKLNQQNTMRELSQKSAEGGGDLATMASQAGYPEVANKMRMQKIKQGVGILEFIKGAAPMVRDQVSLDAFNADARSMGAPQGAYPTEWNTQTQKYLSNLTAKAKKQIINLSPGGKAFDVSGKLIASAPMTPRQRGKGKKGDLSQKRFDLSRRKTLKGHVIGLYGGFYDPVSNRIKGLSKNAHKDIAAIQKRAEEIMRKEPWRDEQDIVNQAAKELGVKGIRNPEGITTDTTGGGITTGGSVSTSDIQPGEETATHPQTGEKRVKRNGQWLKITP